MGKSLNRLFTLYKIIFEGSVIVKKKWIWITIITIAVLGALALFLLRKSTGVETATAKRSSIKEAIYGIGTVMSREHFIYKVSLMKTVAKVFVREGDLVKAGQVLVRMEDTGAVRSPISGIVTSAPYSAGENTAPDSPIVIVQNPQRLYVRANLEQQSALQIKKGLPATLSFESMRGQIFEGEVASVFSKDSQFYAVIDVKALPPQILPDMTSEVAIQVAEKKDVLLVPARSVSVGFVTKVNGARRTKVPVTIGLSDEQWAEITSGDIKEGDVLLLPAR